MTSSSRSIPRLPFNRLSSVFSYVQFQVFVGLIALRKICNHPDLQTGGPRNYDDQFVSGLQVMLASISFSFLFFLFVYFSFSM